MKFTKGDVVYLAEKDEQIEASDLYKIEEYVENPDLGEPHKDYVPEYVMIRKLTDEYDNKLHQYWIGDLVKVPTLLLQLLKATRNLKEAIEDNQLPVETSVSMLFEDEDGDEVEGFQYEMKDVVEMSDIEEHLEEIHELLDQWG